MITDDVIDAAWRVAEEWIERPFHVRVTDYIRTPSDPPPGPARDAAVAALRRADHAAEQRNREIMRQILAAAQAAS